MKEWMDFDWVYLAEGSYNKVYRSSDGEWILKIQHQVSAMDHPVRSVRLWNELNPDLPPASLAQTKLGLGWVCPFILGTQASDDDMHHALLDIFNRTGRILADAPALRNFIKTDTGRVVCIDVGFALQMETRNSFPDSRRLRQRSLVSLNAWYATDQKFATEFFPPSKKTFPNTVDTIKALFMIKNHRPDWSDITFLKSHFAAIQLLAAAYDAPEKTLAVFASIDTEYLNFHHSQTSQNTGQSMRFFKPMPENPSLHTYSVYQQLFWPSITGFPQF